MLNVQEKNMCDVQLLAREAETLPPPYFNEALDFVKFLKQRAGGDKEAVDIPNAVTLKAFEEGDAMLEGRAPCHEFKSLDEFWASLDAED
jgi:hypothetical protein